MTSQHDHPARFLSAVKLDMELTYSDVQNILKIVDQAEHLDEIDLVYGGFRLHLIRAGSRASGKSVAITGNIPAGGSKPAAPIASAVTPRATPEVVVPDGLVAIRAPMLGTFYRAPAPGEKPFVEEGQRVCADDTVCLIEVMKLFNSIRAGVDGEVVKIIAENGSLVEFDQALIFIAPSAMG
jgi:acetyl-CoA carboxylase biotin carboxyl carrier protein